MTDQDLERRLRDALAADPHGPAAQEMVRAARRGELRRRTVRRASAAIALVGAVAVTAGAVLVLRDAPRSLPSQPGPTPTPTETSSTSARGENGERPSTAAVAASSDVFFKLTSNLGCRACSVAWRRAPDGEWEKLHTFGDEAYDGPVNAADYGPLSHLAVSPDGTDMWATGDSMWSSHDGGSTWARVEDGPGRAGSSTSAVAVTPDRAFTVGYVGGVASRVWVSPTGVDDWTSLDSRVGNLFPLGDRVAFLASDEGGSNGRVVATPDGTTFATLPLPERCSALVANPLSYGSTMFVGCVAAGNKEGPVTVWRSVDLGPWEQWGKVAGGLSVYPLSTDRILAADRWGHHDAVLTADGPIPTDVPSGFFSLAVVGEDVLLDGGDGNDRTSSDGGLTWKVATR